MNHWLILPFWTWLCLTNWAVAAPPTAVEAPWRLLPQAQVHAAGVFLNEVVDSTWVTLPHLRLAPAPGLGQVTVFTRAQVVELVRQHAPDLVTSNWSGATQIRITRRLRLLDEAELKEQLTAALQRDFVKERGQLELRLTRPWGAVPIADEAFTFNIVDLPAAGVTPSCVVRFELRAGSTLLGSWQVPLQSHIWREVWVAGSPLRRGQLLKNADVVLERRDVLAFREPLASVDRDDSSVELAENLPSGMPLTVRSLRERPIIQRGKIVEALVQEGSLTISIQAEVLEDGHLGQIVRARNLKSKREFRGKVQNEETLLVAL